MKNKFGNIMRRWRKLTKHQRRLLVFFVSLAVINIPFSPVSSLWLSVLVLYKLLDINQLRMEQYYYYRKGRYRTLSTYIRNRIRLLDDVMELTNKYANLLLEYNKLKAAHNKLLRRRRKENNQ